MSENTPQIDTDSKDKKTVNSFFMRLHASSVEKAKLRPTPSTSSSTESEPLILRATAEE